MKNYMVVLICLLLLQNTFSQNPYYDAIKLAGYIEAGSKPSKFIIPGITKDSLKELRMKEYCEIINSYYRNKFRNCSEVHQKVASYKIDDNLNPDYNPFLTYYLSPGLVQNNQPIVDLSKGLSSAFSSIGGLDVTTIADGFAKFIVKRTKQELSIAFFEKFRNDLDSSKDLKTLFPNTVKLLNALDQQIYNYSAYIYNLREAFRSDINSLDENLPRIIENHPSLFKKDFELGIALKSACYISSSLKHDVHPADILDNYPMYYFKDEAGAIHDTILKGAIQSLQLFSESLKETDTLRHTYWVSMDQIRQLVNNQDALQIYLGLVMEVAKNKYDSVKYSKNASLYGILSKANPKKFFQDYTAYKQYILTLGTKLSELNKMIKQYSAPVTDSLKVEQYAMFFKTSVQFLQFCTKVSTLPHFDTVPALKGLDGKLNKYFDIAYQTCDLTTAINRKRYAEAINHVVAIYNDIVVKSDSKEKGVLSSLAKYGSFMSSMVNAKNSNEVEASIEAVALPTGSARMKRETPFNVALNAYCGLFMGFERIKGIDQPWTWQYQKINTFGVTAPIGISISRGHSVFFFGTGKTGWKDNKYGWSSSMFLSVIDIGAIAAFRFNDDSTQNIPTIQLQDIISPGIFFSLGIAKTPLSVNIGWQMGPLLRAVSATENTYSSKYTRISISLCVDIPIFNFYSKPKE